MDLEFYGYVLFSIFILTLIYLFCNARRVDLERRLSFGRLHVTRIFAENGRRLSLIGQRIEQRFSEQMDPRQLGREVRRRSTIEGIMETSKKPREQISKTEQDLKKDDGKRKDFDDIDGSSKGESSRQVQQNLGSRENDGKDMGNVDKVTEEKPRDANQGNSDGCTVMESSERVKDENEGTAPLPAFKCIVQSPSDTNLKEQSQGHGQSPSVRFETVRESFAKPEIQAESEKFIDGMSPSRQNRVRRDSIMPILSVTGLPRRKSVLPVITDEGAFERRKSLLPTTAIETFSNMSTRRSSVLVKPAAYVCPRKSSVIFNSEIFAHAQRRHTTHLSVQSMPERRVSLCRADSVPRGHQGTGSNSRWTNMKGDVFIWKKHFKYNGRRTSTSGPYPFPRRRSSVCRQQDVMTPRLCDVLEKLPDIRRAVLEGGLKLKDIITGAFKMESTELPRFRRKSLGGRRKSVFNIPKQTGNYLTGNLSEYKRVFGPDAHLVLTEKYRQHGSVYEINALGQKMVFLFDHRDIEALKKSEGTYPKHMDFKHLRIYRQRNNLPLGLLLSHGEEWRHQRRVLSKMLMGTSTVLQYIPIINRVAMEAVETIKNTHTVNQGDVYLPETDIGNYSIEAFGRVLYGRNLNCLEPGGNTDLQSFVDIAKKNFEDAKALLTLPSCLMLLHPAWRRHNERWNFLLESTIKQVRLSMTDDRRSFCVLTQLLNGGKMTEPEMLVNLTDMLLASIDTTTNVILWCLYELARHPTSQVRILDEFFSKNCRPQDVTFECLQGMTFLKATVKESLRLHPVGFLASRTITKSMPLRKYTVPSKANVATCMYVMGRGQWLGEDKEIFRPERWLQKDQTLDQFYNDVPFGFGPRMCIGKRVAEIEIALFILQFCLAFKFTLNPACHVDHYVKLLLVPSRPLELMLKSRL